MNQSVIWFCVSFLCIAILSSCSPRPVIILLNNSEAVVEVQVDGTTRIKINHGQQEKINDFFKYPTFKISIDRGTAKWIYDKTTWPPDNYWRGRNFSTIVKFQIEVTGYIYVLLPTEDFPLKDFTNQPPGFPLKPTQ